MNVISSVLLKGALYLWGGCSESRHSSGEAFKIEVIDVIL